MGGRSGRGYWAIREIAVANKQMKKKERERKRGEVASSGKWDVKRFEGAHLEGGRTGAGRGWCGQKPQWPLECVHLSRSQVQHTRAQRLHPELDQTTTHSKGG